MKDKLKSSEPKIRTVTESWRSIRKSVAKQAPGYERHFDKGAKVSEVRELGEYIGRRLPNDLVESLRCLTSSGAVIPTPSRFPRDMAHSLMDIDEIWIDWSQRTERHDAGRDGYRDDDLESLAVAPGVVQQWWSPSWIPFATDGAGGQICVDIGPTYPGRFAQVIWVPGEERIVEVLAPSLGRFLHELANNYEAGNYEFDEEDPTFQRICNGFMRKDSKTFPSCKVRQKRRRKP